MVQPELGGEHETGQERDELRGLHLQAERGIRTNPDHLGSTGAGAEQAVHAIDEGLETEEEPTTW